MKGNELKPHIGLFGRRNYGKSSLVNYLTGQNIAIVSDMPGTTTDPVKKTMELGGVGPVVWIDTAGIDDEGAVGTMRIGRSLDVLAQVDLALILFTENRFGSEEEQLVEACRKRGIPFLLIYSQSDRFPPDTSLLQSLDQRYANAV
ncbi:MAG: 50S ribosome-binding GTPase, partial [Bacteroidales bacterium]|nr:50S ribosome-binding GTPase [Bacteroidales bacterium]